jgi:hypothetical protein
LPAVVELQDTVAVPEFVMLSGDIAPHVNPAGTVSVKLTVPVNPFNAAIVIVEVAETSVSVAAGDVAESVKSVRVNVADAE